MRFFLLISIFVVNLLTVDASVAAECTEQKIYACSQEELCEAATITILGQSYWRTGLSFVDLAKARGLDCGTSTGTTKLEENSSTQMLQLDADRGVTRDGSNNEIDNQESALDRYNRTGVWTQSPTPPSFRSGHCDAVSPSNCTRRQLCKEATEIIDGKIVWKNGRKEEFVAEALHRRITCGVDKHASGLCELPNDKACNDEVLLCRLATYDGKWRSSKLYAPYVNVAQKRGLNCGSDTSQTTPRSQEKCTVQNLATCSISEFCERATYTDKGILKWNTSTTTAYVVEAKRRNVTCGIKVEKGRKTSSTQCGFNDIGVCSDQDLCAEATFTFKNVIKWKNATHSAWIDEANSRGLNCGVSTTQSTTRNVNNHLNLVGDYILKQISGDWAGMIRCNSRQFPFHGKINASRMKNIVELKTDNFTYIATFKFNETGDRILTDGRRSDGQPFKESFKYSSASNTFHGSTSEGCYLNAKKTLKKKSLKNKLFSKTDFQRLNLTERKQLQYGLKVMGLYSGAIDGLYGPKTEKAVRVYSRSKKLTENFPKSVLNKVLSEVNVPTTFKVVPRKVENTKKEETEKDCVSILSLITGNDALCSKNNGPVIINPPNISDDDFNNSPLQSASCRRDAQCNYGEICVKRSGYTSGTCMTKPSGVRRDWSPKSCTRDTQCGAGARCDRIYKICVER